MVWKAAERLTAMPSFHSEAPNSSTGCGMPHDGVVDDDVHRAEGVERGGDHHLDFRGVSQVSTAVDRADAVGLLDVVTERGDVLRRLESVQNEMAAGLPRNGGLPAAQARARIL